MRAPRCSGEGCRAAASLSLCCRRPMKRKGAGRRATQSRAAKPNHCFKKKKKDLQHLQCLSPIQHQNPTRNVFVATISLPILVPTYSTSGVQERCIFQSIQLEKTHTENSKADSAFLLERHGSAPRVSSPGTSSWLHSRNPGAPLLWERKAMAEAEKSNTSPFR